MATRIEENIPAHKRGVAARLDGQIQALQQNGDLGTVFNRDELKDLEYLGHAKYLAELVKARQSLHEIDLGE